jgi:hypothetical protein
VTRKKSSGQQHLLSFFDVVIIIDIPNLMNSWISDGAVHVQAVLYEAPPSTAAYVGPPSPVLLLDINTDQPMGEILNVQHFIDYLGGLDIHSDNLWPDMPQDDCCEPNATGLGCLPALCPNINEICTPTRVRCGPPEQCVVETCECRDPTQCHVNVALGGPPYCEGDCPSGQTCNMLITANPDATITVECQCEPAPCEPDANGQNCQGGCPPFNNLCFPTVIRRDFGGALRIIDCDCINTFGPTCHVDFDATTGEPVCVNPCGTDPLLSCQMITTSHPDGSVEYRCDCLLLCAADVDCDDDDVCTCDQCVGGTCLHANVEYGNVNCSGPSAPDLDDILCALDGFSVFAACPNADIAGCLGNDVVDLNDIIAVLDGYVGLENFCGCSP